MLAFIDVAFLQALFGFENLKQQRKRDIVQHPISIDRDHSILCFAQVANVLSGCAERPNAKWLADITYIDTLEGFLYLAAVLDVFSRRIVGWAMADHMREQLVEDALHLALTQRQPADTLLHHSDRAVNIPATT